MPHSLPSMKRVLVIGCPGAGKSTFARWLRDATGLPLYYLDRNWHRPDKTNIPREEFDARVAELTACDRWIIDGNYLRTLEPRLARCDTVFFLDLPVEDCLAGVAARRGLPREDMPWVEEEPDEEFLQYIRDFPADQLPEITRLLEQYRAGRRIVTFHSRAEAEAFRAAQSPAGRAGDQPFDPAGMRAGRTVSKK